MERNHSAGLRPNEPVVTVLPDSGTGSVLSYSEGVIQLVGSGQLLSDGEILVSVKDGGFLRKVESVTTQADGSILESV